MKAALELGVFTTAGAVHTTAEAQAAHCHVSVRGMRVLCDYLVIPEFLTKKDTHDGLVPDEAAFLDRIFQTYMGESSVSCFPLN